MDTNKDVTGTFCARFSRNTASMGSEGILLEAIGPAHLPMASEEKAISAFVGATNLWLLLACKVVLARITPALEKLSESSTGIL
jgi:hypothetical protein